MHALGNQKICATCFTVLFTLLQWSGSKPAVSPRYACIVNGFY